jgi:rubrerythrin
MSETRSKTEENLYAAFVGEAKASMRLRGYAEKADKEGYDQIARLFRAIGAAEEIHALKHLRMMNVIRGTQENLEASFESEQSISENVYPEFIRVAVEEGNKAAEISFTHARDAEEVHGKLYKGALEQLIGEIDGHYSVCEVCGYVVEGDSPDECPVCQASKDRFKRVD